VWRRAFYTLLTSQAYRLCLDARPTSRQHFWVFGGLYGLHLLGWLRHGFAPSQFLFVRMASLPRAAADVPALQKELATFLGLSPPPADSAQSGVCLSATMITSKQVIVRAHGAPVRDVKSAFRASPTARNLSAFLARHISPYLPMSPPYLPIGTSPPSSRGTRRCERRSSSGSGCGCTETDIDALRDAPYRHRAQLAATCCVRRCFGFYIQRRGRRGGCGRRGLWGGGGEHGCKALTAALKEGAAPSLKMLRIFYKEQTELVAVCEERGITLDW